MANKIQVLRGLKASLPVLSAGEFGYTTDTKELYIGNPTGGNTQIPTINTPISGMMRQAIINGNFDVWQRGTNFSIANHFVADRWYVGIVADASQGTISRGSLTPGVIPNAESFMRINPTSLVNCQYIVIQQAIEGVRNFAGGKVAISFWAKADASRVLNVYLNQSFGVGGSPLVTSAVSNVSLNTSWTKYTVILDCPSIVGKTIGSNNFISLVIGLPVTTGYTIDIAQVQVNAGDAALPFQPKAKQQEEQDCLRYRWQSWADATASPSTGSVSGVAITSTALLIGARFPVPMRITPTVNVVNNGVSNQFRSTTNGSLVTATSQFFGGGNNKGFLLISISGATFTVGDYYDFDIFADAEL
ncbi:hypothetical protein AB4Z45_08660 [Paenibacillus sp. MCAF9]|uniref:hyaluronate lyase N-terminal domain-containing protein n=1 Tax=Paenibacillus sp. MCAF9 TaxID=3233046 RepID=UPI003F980816